jgi:F0F1-type ATP synthase membrane subunit c/vacuolar-type H+-ATPase subunit K
MAALGGPAAKGSSMAGALGWGAVLVGAALFLAGLSQRLFPDRGAKMTAEQREQAAERRGRHGHGALRGDDLPALLGAVGLWDPWEVHYGEVARTMVVKRDFVFPFWRTPTSSPSRR